MKAFLSLLAAPLLLVGCAPVIRAPLYELQPGKRAVATNAGAMVNDEDDNYAPAVSPDGGALLYASTHIENSPGRPATVTTMIRKVPLDESGNVEATAVPERLFGSRNNAGGISFSGNGRHIALVSCQESDGAGDCDLYEVSDYDAANPVVSNLRQINTRYWESAPFFSDDGNTLYFTAFNRPTPETANARDGNVDIHVTRKNADGFWSKPAPVEGPVNSPYREDGACLAMGDSALFFCSNRPGGYGGFDLYVSFRLPDGGWGPVYNLGPNVNSGSDERYITVSRDGSLVFIASNRGGKGAQGKFDIYRVSFTDAP